MVEKQATRVATEAAEVESPIHQRTATERREERKGRPVRAGVFASPAVADQVVDQLLAAGFEPEEITVICSDKTVQQHFHDFDHQRPAGARTPAAVALGAAIGGVAAVAGTVATGGVSILATAGLAAWSGSVVGGLIGAMMTRGFEKELANFYDQAVTEGKIVVAVESSNPEGQLPEISRLSRAEQILAAAGSEPMPLPEG